MSVLDDPLRVRKAVGGLAAIAGLALGVLTALNRPLVGVVIYAVAMVGVVAVHSRTERPVFDERDEAIAKEAAQLTLTIFGWGSAGVFPVLTAAWGLGYFEWGPATSAVALSVAVLYLTYTGFVFALQQRR